MTILPWSNLWSYAVANGIGSMVLLAEVTGEHLRQLHRWKGAGGMGEPYADRVACSLGVSVNDIWPEALEAAIEAEQARLRALEAARRRRYRANNPAYVERGRAYNREYKEYLRQRAEGAA